MTVLVLAIIGLGVVAFVPGVRNGYATLPDAPNTGGTTIVTPTSPTNNNYTTNYISTTTVVQTPTSPATNPSHYYVTLTADEFDPSPLYIKKGDTVTFVNNGTTTMWIASNPHPQHNDLPGFDELTSVQPGSSWSYTFGVTGTYRYHNETKTSMTGTIVVR